MSLKAIVKKLRLFKVIFNLFYKIKIINYLLFIAARNGHDEIVKELLNRNAFIEAKDVDGLTPLIWGLFSRSFFNFTQSICDCLQLQNAALLKWLKNYLIVMLILKRKIKMERLHLFGVYF